MEQLPWSRFSWLNPPASAAIEGDALVAVTDNETDFWRPSSGPALDSGHFFGAPLLEAASVEVEFSGDFLAEFDQAGLMIRSTPEAWLKAGVELAEGALQASVVVTAARSDWSVAPVPVPPPRTISIRANLAGEEVLIFWAADGGPFRLLRVASLHLEPATLVGPFCCSPKRAGLEVRFGPLFVEPAR